MDHCYDMDDGDTMHGPEQHHKLIVDWILLQFISQRILMNVKHIIMQKVRSIIHLNYK